MRICIVAESYPPALGGAESALQQLAEGFAARGHEVRVVTASWEGHPPGIHSEHNVTIVRVRTFAGIRRLWFLLFSLPAAIRAARWADIVQGSTFAGGLPAFVGAWLAGKKKVLLVHEVWGKRWRDFEPSTARALFYRLAEWIIARLPFDHYIAVSDYTSRCLQSIGVEPKRVSTIYLGNSRFSQTGLSQDAARRELGFAADDFVFLSYGRVGISKGFEYLAEAIPELVNRLPRARFVLVLSSYDQRIWRRVRQSLEVLPLNRSRLLTSLPRAELAKYVAAADVVVIPSLSEGFGFSALEACNAGKIVVSTDAGSLPEVVFGKHVFVKPGSGQALLEGCLKAYNGEVEELPRKEFTWEKTAMGYLEIYEQLLLRE